MGDNIRITVFLLKFRGSF